nr:Crp/Fnr family transcriptional regulator [Bradyrhizobium sp. dw_78]
MPGNPAKGRRHQLLSENERAQLAKISSIVRFKKGDRIYSEGDAADAAFNIISGVVAAYRNLPDDGEHIASLLHPGDIFGLSEEGRYTNACRAVTPVVAYKIPVTAMRRLLANSTDLDVDVIIKLCEELRRAQRHAFLLTQKRSVPKLAMFLDLHEHLQTTQGESASEIYLPMDRSDIAAYLGLTLSAVSRAFRTLISQKVISCRDRRHVKILDRKAFEKIADSQDG